MDHFHNVRSHQDPHTTSNEDPSKDLSIEFKGEYTISCIYIYKRRYTYISCGSTTQTLQSKVQKPMFHFPPVLCRRVSRYRCINNSHYYYRDAPHAKTVCPAIFHPQYRMYHRVVAQRGVVRDRSLSVLHESWRVNYSSTVFCW
jgi:hypothetical protein